MFEYKNSKDAEQRNHDPPILDWDKNLDLNALAAEERIDLQSAENQRRLEEFLASDYSGEPDLTAIEESDRANQHLDGWEDWVEAEANQRFVESMTTANPFFAKVSGKVNDTLPPLATAVEKDTQPSADGGIPPPRGPAMVASASGDGVPNHLNPYQAMQWVIRNAHVARAGELLYFYDGTAHLPCKRDEAKRQIMAICRSAIESAGSPRFVSQVYDFLTVEPSICRDTDLCCNAVALDDGVLDLNTWQLRPHTPSLFVTTRLRASYQKGLSTDCPVFKKFLADITCGDSVLTQRIWQALGFLLAPDQSEKYFILFQGVSNSGKSVLGNFVRNCFIGDVTTSLELNELSGRFTLSELVGKKFCSDLDLPAEPLKNRAVSNLKKMTGHDQITSDVKFSDRAKFTCTAKFLFGTNHAILLKKKDPAFLNRLVVIPFFRSFNGKEQDRTLLNRLEWERDAVVMKALTAYREFARNGSCFAGDYQVNQVIGCNAHSSAEDAVADFLGFKCMKAEGAWTSTEALYNAFTQTYGILCEKARFSELLLQTAEAMGVTVEKGRGRPVPGANPVWGFTGIILK